MQFSFFASFFSRFGLGALRNTYDVIYQTIPARVWVILPPLKLRTRHIGQAPGSAGASPDLSKLPGGKRGKLQVRFCVIEATADAVQACHREFWNEFGGAGQQAPRANTRRAERPRPPLGEYQRRR